MCVCFKRKCQWDIPGISKNKVFFVKFAFSLNVVAFVVVIHVVNLTNGTSRS